MVVAQRIKHKHFNFLEENKHSERKKRMKLRLSKNEPQHKIQEVTLYLPS